MVGHKYFIKMRTKVRCLVPEDDETDIRGFLATPEKTKNVSLFLNCQWEIFR